MAAGMGARYGGLKQMEAVGPGGECILDYTIHDAVQAGFGKAVFVIRPDFAEAFKLELGRRFERKLAVNYAFQELGQTPAWFGRPAGREKPWGTGHAVLTAEHLINGPFALVNADDFYGRRGFEAMAAFLKDARDTEPARYAMVGYELQATLSEHGTVSRGVCEVAADGNLVAVRESLKVRALDSGARDQVSGRDFDGHETVSMNFFGFTPSIFGHLTTAFDAFLRQGQAPLATAEFQLPAVVDALVQSRRAVVTVLPSKDRWLGLTNPEDKPKVAAAIAAMVEQGSYPKRLRD